MTRFRSTALTLLAAAALAACGSLPPRNSQLEDARSAYRGAQADGRTSSLAPTELRLAGEALMRAETAQTEGQDAAQVNQLAYLARQRTALALEVGRRKGSEAAVADAGANRDSTRLAARTREADSATQSAANANRDAASANRDAASAQQQTAAMQQRADASQQQAALSQQQAAALRQQAGASEQRNQALEGQLRELNARQTDRGLVVTVGDMLFDTGRADLKAGSVSHIARLGNFLKQYPQRKAMIEGYTDSTGSEPTNQRLSDRRADAVMAALVGMGVGRGQLAAQGFGEMHPVADNDSVSGRLMNRRVEIVLSDENGVLSNR